MGHINKLLSFVRNAIEETAFSDVTVDRGGGDNRTLQHFPPIGDDSFPLEGDYVHSSNQTGTGRDSAVGYIDPKNLQKSESGEKRIYSRESSGEQIAECWLKNDGEVLIQNDNCFVVLNPSGIMEMNNGAGYIKLLESGVIEMNGAKVTVEGDFVTNTGVSSNNHYHSQGSDSDGDSEVPTDAPTATE